MKTKFSAPVFEIKSLEETGLFSGYGAVFGNKDSYGDVIEPGAFSVSLEGHAARKSRPKLLWQHIMAQPIGKWLEYGEDNTGLYMKGQLNMGVQQAREAYALLKSGDIDGLSIGYQTIKSEPDKKNGVLLLKQLELIEVSVVSAGANDRALVDAVKEVENSRNRLAAGERLSEREWEGLFKDYLELSNSEAERAVRVHSLKLGQGEPDVDPLVAFWEAMRAGEN